MPRSLLIRRRGGSKTRNLTSYEEKAKRPITSAKYKRHSFEKSTSSDEANDVDTKGSENKNYVSRLYDWYACVARCSKDHVHPRSTTSGNNTSLDTTNARDWTLGFLSTADDDTSEVLSSNLNKLWGKHSETGHRNAQTSPAQSWSSTNAKPILKYYPPLTLSTEEQGRLINPSFCKEERCSSTAKDRLKVCQQSNHRCKYNYDSNDLEHNDEHLNTFSLETRRKTFACTQESGFSPLHPMAYNECPRREQWESLSRSADDSVKKMLYLSDAKLSDTEDNGVSICKERNGYQGSFTDSGVDGGSCFGRDEEGSVKSCPDTPDEMCISPDCERSDNGKES